MHSLPGMISWSTGTINVVVVVGGIVVVVVVGAGAGLVVAVPEGFVVVDFGGDVVGVDPLPYLTKTTVT